jgi:hypothetical protein
MINKKIMKEIVLAIIMDKNKPNILLTIIHSHIIVKIINLYIH